MQIDIIRDSNLEKIDKMLDDKDGIDIMFSPRWAEHEATIFVQQELNKYRGIFDASGISTKDKGISYDGIVEVMNNASEKGTEWIGQIDVQVKGTCVDEIRKGNSKFSIEVTHLENYTKHPLGVLLFVVQIKRDTLEKKIFYRYLLPVDLQKIFMSITNQKTKTIDIYPIDSNQKNMLKRKCLQFLKAREMQVGKRIIILDESKQPLEVFVQDLRDDKNEYLKDKVYLYVKLNEDEGLIPAIMPQGARFGSIDIIKQSVVIQGVKYYDYIKKIIEDEEILYQYGENVTFNSNKNLINFKFRGSITELINDMSFAIALTKLTKNGLKHRIPELEKNLKIIKEFEKNLKKINIILKDRFEQFTYNDYLSMEHFNKMMNNDEEILKKIDISKLYSIRVGGKSILLLLNKNQNGVKIYNFFDNISEKLTITIKKEKQYIRICPYTILVNNMNFEEMLNYKKEAVSIAIRDSENNEINREFINLLALSIINSYDKTEREDFYELANELIDKLLEWVPDENVYKINKMQLIKRKRPFTDEERDKLYDIKENEKDNIELQYGISILLENKSDIEHYYSKFDEKVKKEFSEYPIQNLITK